MAIVCDPDSREVFGDLALHLGQQARTAEVGYTLAAEHWGKGYAVEALEALVEYLYDARDDTAPPILADDDLFVGSRLALNDTQDTQVLAGAIIDRNDGSTLALIEAERRIGSRYKIELETRWFFNVDSQNTLAFFEQDSFVTLRFSRFF